MKKGLVFTLCFCFAINCIAQVNGDINFKHDKKHKYLYKNFASSLNYKIKPNFRKVNIEIRIWSLDLATMELTLVKIAKLKESSTWTPKKHIFPSGNPNNHIVDDKFVLPTDWNSIWKEINSKGYLTIRNQDIVNKEVLSKYPNLGLMCVHGSQFSIEVLTKKKKKSIRYANSEVYKELGLRSQITWNLKTKNSIRIFVKKYRI